MFHKEILNRLSQQIAEYYKDKTIEKSHTEIQSIAEEYLRQVTYKTLTQFLDNYKSKVKVSY